MKAIVITTLFIAGLLIFACRSKKDIAETPVAVVEQKPLITYSKGSCRGFCPVLQIEIFENGLVKYNGEKHVDHVGQFSITLEKDKMSALLSKLDKAGFPELQNNYLSGFMDIPDMKMSYQGKNIRFHTRKAPKILVSIMDDLDEIALNTNWKSAPKK